MSKTKLALVAGMLLLTTGQLHAAKSATFRARWEGKTIEATPLTETAVFVLSSGEGQGSHLGKFTLQVPHTSYLDTLAVEGSHIFITSNGDQVVANFSGFFIPRADGCLEATLPAVFTGNGTGRLAGTTGSYDFNIVACPSPTGFGFDSTATMEGTISVGK